MEFRGCISPQSLRKVLQEVEEIKQLTIERGSFFMAAAGLE